MAIIRVLLLAVLAAPAIAAPPERLRLLIETDAGGDPDDEQSLVRFLLYTSEWDIEGIIVNREKARDGENLNPVRTGFGIVRAQIEAYARCLPNLLQHDPHYPSREHLWERTVPGHGSVDDGVRLILRAADSPDPRPLWYSDWGSDNGSGLNNMHRALDLVLQERGPEGYARFKGRLRLASHENFGKHTGEIGPPFPLWVNTFQPEINRLRWYHRFSAITAKAGGFDAERDLLTGHGPLGALYPTNTTHWLKEGDSMTFLYLVPTGMNEPLEPTWGSWAGRYGRDERSPGKPYYWANQEDEWNGATSRDNTLARWAADLQNDFRARLDWCVQPPAAANHAPRAALNGDATRSIVRLEAAPGAVVELDASASSDPDEQRLSFAWTSYPEAGSFAGRVSLEATGARTSVRVPMEAAGKTIHIVLTVRDDGSPPLAAYRRAVLTVGEPKETGYFPPPESQGGWRAMTAPDDVRRVAGLDPEKIAALRDWLLASDDRDFAAVMVRRGHVVLEVERGNSAKTDTRRVASVSKAVCATVLAIAAEESRQGRTPRKMTFDDPALTFIPWAEPLSDPRKARITVRQLLNHTSGICPEATGAPNDGSWEYVMGHTGDARTAQLAFEPGTASGYSTHALDHAALVCETVTGKPYNRFAIEALFQPLGIERWWFQEFDGDAKHGRHPTHGLGLSARDLARIAYCMLRDGRWGERQVVPR